MNKVWLAIVCLLMLLVAVTLLTTSVADAQTGWEFRRTITVDHTQVGADLADFPVLISLGGEWLKYQPSGDPGHIRQPDGGDIRFTTSSLVQLDHEIEAYDGVTGTLVAWVRVPLLSSSTDTQFYMWYGNAGCEDQWNPKAVWDEHFVMVHHLEETAGTHQDSTANGHDGTPLGGIVQDAVGQVDGADEFDGIDARIDCGTGRTGWSHQDVGYQRAVIQDGKVYAVGGGDHSLPDFHSYGYIFDLHTGDLLLRSPSLGKNTFTASETGPVIDGDVVYVCPTEGNISAWNTITNTLVWTTTDLSIWSSRIEFDGTYLYATTTDYQVVKIDTSNGGVVTATFNLDPDTDDENAVAPYLDEQEGAVYALGASKLYKLSASDLSEIWNRDIGSGCLDTGSGHSRMLPIVVDDEHTGDEPWVIAGCWGNDIFYAYDAAGNLEWTRYITGGVRALASYHPGNGYLYIPSQGDGIYVLDVADGRVQFVVDSSDVPDGSGFGSPCTLVDDYLVFKNMSGTTRYLYLFDAATGEYVTRYTLGTNLFLTCFPVAASQGYLITGGSLINYGGSDGGIFAVKAGEGEAVDYYPLHGPYRFGYIENALTDLGNDLNPLEQITLEAWANIDELTTDTNDHLLCRRDAYCLKFAQTPADTPRFQLYDATSGWYNLDLTPTLTQSTWYHLAGTWDGAEMQLYVNGSLEARLDYTGTLNATDHSTWIGSYDGSTTPPNQSPDGRIDEVRLSSVARSAEWIAAAYSNQSAPSSFYTLGPEQQPAVEIAKLPDSQLVTGGSDATFTILVSNTGAFDLEDLTVIDELTPDCDRFFATLPAGQSLSYTCTATCVTTDFENSVTVSGTAVGGTHVEFTDTAFVDVLPGFSLSKTAEPAEMVDPGGTVNFTIHLTNTCAEPITLTALVDSIHGDVSGQGDCVLPQAVDPGGDYACAFTATVSGPAGYVEIDEVTAGCIDDESNLVEASDRATVTIEAVPDVLVVPTSLEVSEPDGSDTFLLTLTSEPTAVVSIPLAATAGECTVWPMTATLDAGNWHTGVTATVTAVDDDIDDGPQACPVETGLAISADGNYHGLDPEDVAATIYDDDEAGIVVSPTSLIVSEPDGSDTFAISLTSQPTETVFIDLAPSNDECDVSPRIVALEAGNWRDGVSVSVTALDDDVQDGSRICIVQAGPARSDAPQYQGMEVDDVTVTVQDDEVFWQLYLPLAIRGWPPVPEVPALHPIDNSAGLGTYPVTWDTAARAETYILEEAKASAFDLSWQIYAGPATNHLVSGQGAARYYYRVKARNSWGDSGWSDVEQVDVLWEAEPNDDGLTQANGPIVSGLTYSGTFTQAADLQDYFYFDLSASGSVELDLTNIASGENYDLVLRDASLETVVGYSALPGNANEHIPATPLPAGRYYIQVYHFSGLGTDQPYHLRVVYDS